MVPALSAGLVVANDDPRVVPMWGRRGELVSTLQCPATLLVALREALGAIADQTPGETTVVLGLDDLRDALAVLARLEAATAEVGAADSLELVIDADDWTCRSGTRDAG